MRSLTTRRPFGLPHLRGALVVASLLTGAACGGGGGGATPPTTPPPPPPPVTPPGATAVAVTNNQFTPSAVAVSTGKTVTWTWDTCSGGGYGGGQTCVVHDIVFDDGQTSGMMAQGSFSRTFATAGTYPYHCSVHGTTMSGQVVVQ